ncbi:hypothetical protein C4K25_3995 [Pseudomonas chlororaphis]|nr:hypothetical protein C4K25_3995 [Pseudomonas chlororaphis]
MTELTQKMLTHCVGRLLIDLPEGTTWEANDSSAQLGGYLGLSVTTGVTEADFKALVARRWSEIEAEEKRSTWPTVQPARRETSLENSAVLSYGYHENEGPDLDGVVRKDVFHDAEGYLWRDGTLFKLGPMLNGATDITRWLPRLHARKNDEVPNKPGLCLNGAFVDSYYDLTGPYEIASWRFSLPKNLGLVVRHTKVWEPEQPMLERYREAESEFAGLLADELTKPGVVAGRKEYRAKKRNVGGLEGDEYVVGGTEGKSTRNYFETNVGGEWSFPGTVTPSPMPSINIDLGTTFQTTIKPAELGDFPAHDEAPGYPTEVEFFELWDTILNSIRYRPGALTPPPPGSNPTISSSSVRPAPLSGGADDYALEEFLADLKPNNNWMDEL